MNSDRAKVQPKKLFEPANREELLRGWLLHAHKGRDRHDLAARRNDTYRYWLGVPAIILSAVAGTSVFASLQTQVDSALKIVVGLVSITSAVLASLQTFYNFASQAESHRMAGVKYKTIIRELEQVLTQPLEQLPDKADYLDDLRKRLDELEEEAPVVPEGIYRQVEERYARVVFAENVAALVQ
ncbi:MAG: SLATT domain-containing protein [Pyrinomonadaceae bacterium]